MIKKLPSIIILCLFSLMLAAQENASTVSDVYLRNTLTTMFLDLPDTDNWRRVRSNVNKIEFSAKYDNHNLSSLFYDPSFNRRYNRFENITDPLQNSVERDDIARVIVEKWFNRQENGLMDMELVHKLGRYTVNDEQVLKAGANIRGEAVLKDLGEKLLNRSYLLLIRVRDIETFSNAGLFKKDYGWKAHADGYLYRVDFNDNVKHQLYESWIYEDDAPEVVNQKINDFKKINFSFEHIETVSASLLAMDQEDNKKRKSMSELSQELIQEAYDDMLHVLEKRHPELIVHTPLFVANHLLAKIGLKEGLKTDHRYFVYEHLYDPENNSVRKVRRGVIRVDNAKFINDNRHNARGNTGFTKFYQVAGRKLQPGYTLEQKNDERMEIIIGRRFGGAQGIYGRLDVRRGPLNGKKASYRFAEVSRDVIRGNIAPLWDARYEEFTVMQFSMGAARGYQLTRNSEIRPYLALGVEVTDNKNLFSGDDNLLSTGYIKVGTNLAINVFHNFQIVGGADWPIYVARFSYEDNPDQIFRWRDIFEDRMIPSVLTGVKVMF